MSQCMFAMSKPSVWSRTISSLCSVLNFPSSCAFSSSSCLFRFEISMILVIRSSNKESLCSWRERIYSSCWWRLFCSVFRSCSRLRLRLSPEASRLSEAWMLAVAFSLLVFASYNITDVIIPKVIHDRGSYSGWNQFGPRKGSLFHSGDYMVDSSGVVACDCDAGPDISKYKGFQIR